MKTGRDNTCDRSDDFGLGPEYGNSRPNISLLWETPIVDHGNPDIYHGTSVTAPTDTCSNDAEVLDGLLIVC